MHAIPRYPLSSDGWGNAHHFWVAQACRCNPFVVVEHTYYGMLKMATLAARQLASTASTDDSCRLQAALHNQEEPCSHQARSQKLGCCHKAAPKSLIFSHSTPRYGALPFYVANLLCTLPLELVPMLVQASIMYCAPLY